MMMFMVLMVLGIILSFFQIFVMGLGGIPLAIAGVAINVYIFLCIYSLYDLFRNEKLVANGPGSMAPGTQHTVVYMNHPQGGVLPQPYHNQQYMQQSTSYVQQPAAYPQLQSPAYPQQQSSVYPQENPPLYAQQADIQAKTRDITSINNQNMNVNINNS